MRILTARIVLAMALLSAPFARAATLDVTTATIADVQAALETRKLSSEKLTAAYLARIKAYDKQGPAINAVIMVNPNAIREARAMDRERRAVAEAHFFVVQFVLTKGRNGFAQVLFVVAEQ